MRKKCWQRAKLVLMLLLKPPKRNEVPEVDGSLKNVDFVALARIFALGTSHQLCRVRKCPTQHPAVSS